MPKMEKNKKHPSLSVWTLAPVGASLIYLVLNKYLITFTITITNSIGWEKSIYARPPRYGNSVHLQKIKHYYTNIQTHTQIDTYTVTVSYRHYIMV